MDSDSKPSFIERLTSFLLREPEDREQLIAVLHAAYDRNLLDADALTIIEGALAASDARVSEVMIPRSQMDVIDINDALIDFLPLVLDTAHSRFPVVDGDRDKVIGILLAKDLLRIHSDDEFNLRDWLRPAVFIPKSKRLNVLLREFRVSRNHMAIVVDEYGGVCGLVTIEDVLEQIVGDIEDEYDFDDEADNIIALPDGRFRVRALTEIEQLNAHFNTALPADDVDTVGGLVANALGRVPRRGDKTTIDGLQFEVQRADARQVDVLIVSRAPAADDAND